MVASPDHGAPVPPSPDFEDLFAHPSIQKMLDQLTWQQFEDFIQHVFESAGYTVVKVASRPRHHVDLHLFAGTSLTKPTVHVEVRRYASTSIHKPRVLQFIGGVHNRGGHAGFLVTTSRFTKDAREAAEESRNPKITLIDGTMLLRYITYLGGSRLSGQFAGAAVAPTQPISPAILEEADTIYGQTTHAKRKVRVMAIVNPKGGVAKTTSSLNIAFALADVHHKRVLLVDMDGQGSLTGALPLVALPGAGRGSAPPQDTAFISDYFRGKQDLASLVRPTRFPNLSLIPSESQLYRLQLAGGNRAHAELEFVRDVRGLAPPDETVATPSSSSTKGYDWIIFDTPAGDTFYSRAALASADYIVVPAFVETFAVYGLNELLTATHTMSALGDNVERWNARILGCAITRKSNSRTARDNAHQLRLWLDGQGITVFKHEIPHDDQIETAHRGTVSGGTRNIFHIGRQLGRAAEEYDRLVEEILEHVHNREAQNNHR